MRTEYLGIIRPVIDRGLDMYQFTIFKECNTLEERVANDDNYYSISQGARWSAAGAQIEIERLVPRAASLRIIQVGGKS